MQGDHDATIELDGANKLKSGSGNAGLEKNEHESKGTLTIKDDKGKDGSLTAEGGDDGAGIGGGIKSTGSSITIQGGAVKAVGGSNAAGIGDGAGVLSEIDPGAPSNPNNIIICGDAEVTAKAGSQILDAEAPAIGGKYGEVPTDALSDAEHKVTGGRLTRLNADGTVMEGMGYDYTSTPTPSRTMTTTMTTRMTPRPRHRRMPPNPCPAAWWWAASFPAGSPSAAGPCFGH